MNLPSVNTQEMLTASPWLFATVGIYLAAKRIHRRYPKAWLSPILTAPLTLIALTELTRTTYDEYRLLPQWLVWLLGPATIAFAVPVFNQRKLIAKLPWTLFAATIAGCITSVTVTWLCATALDLPNEFCRTLLPRSVSTPFALPISQQLHGVADLTVLSVLITGMLGMVLGPAWLKMLGFQQATVVGPALGAAAHGIGTARAYQLSAQHGTLSSLTMIFSGVAMSLATSLLLSM